MGNLTYITPSAACRGMQDATKAKKPEPKAKKQGESQVGIQTCHQSPEETSRIGRIGWCCQSGCIIIRDQRCDGVWYRQKGFQREVPFLNLDFQNRDCNQLLSTFFLAKQGPYIGKMVWNCFCSDSLSQKAPFSPTTPIAAQVQSWWQVHHVEGGGEPLDGERWEEGNLGEDVTSGN